MKKKENGETLNPRDYSSVKVDSTKKDAAARMTAKEMPVNKQTSSVVPLDRNPSYKKATEIFPSQNEETPKGKNNKNPSNPDDSVVKIAKAAQKKRDKARQDELRLTASFLVVIFVFVISWLPFCVTMFWSVFSDSPVPRLPDMITLLLGCLNSCCNPIIYGVMNSKFSQGFKKLYCQWKCCPYNNRDVTSSSLQNRSSSYA